MGTERAAARRLPAALALLLLAGSACHSSPAPESAPSPAPRVQPDAAPSPAPPPAALSPLPAEAPASEAEKKALEPGPSEGATQQSLGAGGIAPRVTSAAPRRPAAASRPAPAKAKKPAKGRSVEAEEDFGIADRDESGSGPELRRRLDDAYRAATPDCPSARDRKKAVCDLATQICQLTERDPNVASVLEYCDEARRRCSDAERRTQQRCPE